MNTQDPLDEKDDGSETSESTESSKSKADQSFSPLRLLMQLKEELESYYNAPEGFDLQHLKELSSSFFKELKKIVKADATLDHFAQSILNSELSLNTAIKWVMKAQRLLQSDEVDEYGLDRRFELAIKPFFDWLYTSYFRVTAKGIENIPNTGAALLVANHSGVLPYDAAMMKIACFHEHPKQRELRFLVDDFVFHFPFLGTLMNRIGGVRACPENAERLLGQGELISVFPEGIKGISKPYTERYRLQRFGRGGTIRMAMKTKAPIIPVAIVGAEEIHPLIYKSQVLARPLRLPFIPVTPTFPILGPIGAIPLPTKWTIVFGKPIAFDHYQERDVHDSILVNQENEKLRETIQDMVYEILKDRRSVFLG